MFKSKSWWIVVLFMALLVAQTAAGAGPGPMAADSVFSDYTARSVIQVLIITALVSVLLIGGILAVNFGLMSKREEDRTGGRTPSDSAILKSSVWPEQRESRRIFPAVEGEENEIHRVDPEAYGESEASITSRGILLAETEFRSDTFHDDNPKVA